MTSAELVSPAGEETVRCSHTKPLDLCQGEPISKKLLLALMCAQHKARPLHAGCCSQHLHKPLGALALLMWWHQEEHTCDLHKRRGQFLLTDGLPQRSSRCRSPGPEPLLTCDQHEAQPLQANCCSMGMHKRPWRQPWPCSSVATGRPAAPLAALPPQADPCSTAAQLTSWWHQAQAPHARLHVPPEDDHLLVVESKAAWIAGEHRTRHLLPQGSCHLLAQRRLRQHAAGASIPRTWDKHKLAVLLQEGGQVRATAAGGVAGGRSILQGSWQLLGQKG